MLLFTNTTIFDFGFDALREPKYPFLTATSNHYFWQGAQYFGID